MNIAYKTVIIARTILVQFFVDSVYIADKVMASLLKGLEEKGTDAGVDLATSGGKAAAKGALNLATDESRKVVVKLTNNTEQKWVNPKIFLNCGATDDVLPLTVDHEGETEYKVHKKKMTFSGVAGVLSYEWTFSGKNYTLVVLFHKPMMSRHNNWNAVIYEDKAEANQELFKALKEQSEHPPLRGDSNYTNREFGPYTVQGAMASTGAVVHVTVSCKS